MQHTYNEDAGALLVPCVQLIQFFCKGVLQVTCSCTAAGQAAAGHCRQAAARTAQHLRKTMQNSMGASQSL